MIWMMNYVIQMKKKTLNGNFKITLFIYQKHWSIYQKLTVLFKYQRSVSDISYQQGHVGDYAQASRHNPKCREFDVKYGFLNPETNRYWDEKDN